MTQNTTNLNIKTSKWFDRNREFDILKIAIIRLNNGTYDLSFDYIETVDISPVGTIEKLIEKYKLEDNNCFDIIFDDNRIKEISTYALCNPREHTFEPTFRYCIKNSNSAFDHSVVILLEYLSDYIIENYPKELIPLSKFQTSLINNYSQAGYFFSRVGYYPENRKVQHQTNTI